VTAFLDDDKFRSAGVHRLSIAKVETVQRNGRHQEARHTALPMIEVIL
jgi:hypothetical protein